MIWGWLTSRLAGPILGGLLLLSLGFGGLKWTDAHHWHKQSYQFEKLYHAEQSAHQQTELNYRRAADQARAADAANVARVKAEQSAITKKVSNEYEARIADARARAERLRGQVSQTGTDPGGRGAAPVSSNGAAPGEPDGSAAQGGLPPSDALIATEQAIQLDELQKWVRGQAEVDPNGAMCSGSNAHPEMCR